MNPSAGGDSRTGLLYGVAAFGAWGCVPVYFKAVAAAGADQILAHRVVWSMVVLGVLTLTGGRLGDLVRTFRDRRSLAALALTALLVSVNWFTFIWAMKYDRVLEASLGYFINPLVSVALGMLFLRERLRPLGAVSVGLALLGVSAQVVMVGRLPLVSLVVAFSFGFYGLVRKVVRPDAVVGMTVENLFLTGPALLYLIWVDAQGQGAFGGGDGGLTLLLVLAGPVTALPLLWFNQAARRLPLATMGFLQYIAPSLQFVMAMLYGESFGLHQAVTFVCVWTALLLFSVDTIRHRRGRR